LIPFAEPVTDQASASLSFGFQRGSMTASATLTGTGCMERVSKGGADRAEKPANESRHFTADAPARRTLNGLRSSGGTPGGMATGLRQAGGPGPTSVIRAGS